MNTKLYNNFPEDVASGNIENKQVINITGYKSSITTEELVWSVGGSYPSLSEAVLSISSASAQDKEGGSGATTITLQGLDRYGIITTETVELNGTDAVSTTNKFASLSAATVDKAAAGKITIVSGSTTLGEILVGYNCLQQSIFIVPEGYVFKLIDLDITNTATTSATVKLMSDFTVARSWDVLGSLHIDFEYPIVFTSSVSVRASNSGADTVRANFRGILQKVASYLPTPAGFTLTAGDAEIEVAWTALTSAQRANIKNITLTWLEDDEEVGTINLDSDEDGYTIEGLTNDIEYTVNMVFNPKDNLSGAATSTSGTATPEAPPVPEEHLYVLGTSSFAEPPVPTGSYAYSTDLENWTTGVITGKSGYMCDSAATDGTNVYLRIAEPEGESELAWTSDGTTWSFDTTSGNFTNIVSYGDIVIAEVADGTNSFYLVDDGVLTEITTYTGQGISSMAGNSTAIYLSDSGEAYKSTDSGANFTKLTEDPSVSAALAALDGLIIAAEVGDPSGVSCYYTKDEGATAWVSNSPFDSETEYAFVYACAHGTRIFLIATAGDFSSTEIYRTTDPSVGWSSNKFSVGGGLVGVSITSLGGKLVLLLSDPADGFTSYIATSSDNGDTWSTPVKLVDDEYSNGVAGF